MNSIKVCDRVYWVGAVDWDVRNFHGHHYSTHRGTTYNAYLVLDEKIALVDSVYTPFFEEMLSRIKGLIDPDQIDYVIANHGEIDHSGGLPEILKIANKAKLVCTPKGRESLHKHFYGDWDVITVRTGDEIDLGEKRLRFVETPMLHWPDSMFTYIEKDALLLPNDAFGQHLASSGRFDDQVEMNTIMEEAAKYFANILTPFSPLIVKKIDEITEMNLKIEIIGPSHGIIWRRNPGKIIEAYLRWAKGEGDQRILVVYETMWGSTGKMARKIVEGIISEGVEARLYNLATDERTDILKEFLESKAMAIGSSTINRGALPHVTSLLEELRGLRFVNKMGAAFGSYGWAGGR
ncbi:MAG: MBL fold metallo-hydrolase [bacterium]